MVNTNALTETQNAVKYVQNWLLVMILLCTIPMVGFSILTKTIMSGFWPIEGKVIAIWSMMLLAAYFITHYIEMIIDLRKSIIENSLSKIQIIASVYGCIILMYTLLVVCLGQIVHTSTPANLTFFELQNFMQKTAPIIFGPAAIASILYIIYSVFIKE